jgi:hypothetical protein
MENKEIEKCVVCYEETQYSIDENIENRNCYIEGCGQLCYKCFENLCYQNI